jgi:hypothetical protein
MLKNRGKSKLSKTVLFNANKHVFHCEKSLGTLVYGQPSYFLLNVWVSIPILGETTTWIFPGPAKGNFRSKCAAGEPPAATRASGGRSSVLGVSWLAALPLGRSVSVISIAADESECMPDWFPLIPISRTFVVFMLWGTLPDKGMGL